MKSFGMREARDSLADLVAKAGYGGESTILTRAGKPLAVLVPYEWFERAQKALGEAAASDE